jgi:acyl carrier protein
VSIAAVTYRNGRLIAYVVPQPGAGYIESAARKYIERRLTPMMIPAAIVALDELPLTVQGKVDRAALSQLDPPAPPSSVSQSYEEVSPSSVAGDNVRSRVLQLAARAFGASSEALAGGGTFQEIDGDSLSLASLLDAIEREFDLVLEYAEIAARPTIELLSSLIESRLMIQRGLA